MRPIKVNGNCKYLYRAVDKHVLVPNETAKSLPFRSRRLCRFALRFRYSSLLQQMGLSLRNSS
ncbi:MAG: hypothetical protein HQL31_02550 [Planctomycetes bacterium]|nr:hypothetical protein [Planctomycetota bacterium]